MAFLDAASSSLATVMSFDGATWNHVGSAGFSASWVESLDLVIDASNQLFAAYQDWGNAGKATVMRFAQTPTPTPTAAPPVPAAGPAGTIALLLGMGALVIRRRRR